MAIRSPKPQRLRVGVRAVLAFGSNLGDRAGTIASAMDELDATPGVHVEARSGLVESEAVKLSGEDASAPRYLNAVALIGTTLPARSLLELVNRVEAAHGRVRDERWGDRTLDIDIIDYDGRESGDPELTLPHPRAAERAFVLVPWLQLNADASLVGVGSVAALLEHVTGGVSSYQAGTHRAAGDQQ